MKKLLLILRPAALIGIGLLLAVISAALGQPALTDTNYGAAGFMAQSTLTPSSAVGTSEIGSTDGLIIASVVIVLIIIVPILLRRKVWSK